MAKVLDFLTDLSYLLGEDSVPTTGIDSRIGFINRVCEDIVGRYRWSWNQATASVTITTKAGDLPTDYRMGGMVTCKDQDDNFYTEVDEQYIGNYSPYTFYVNGNDVDGYVITVNNDTATTLTVEYCKRAPLFAGSVDTKEFAIPIKMAVSRGALIDVRRSENPFADVAPETQEFENDIKKIYKLERQLKSRYQVITSKAHYNGTDL